MQSSAREVLQVVAERFVAERWLENCDLTNFDGVNKTLYEVTRAKWKDLLRQAIWESPGAGAFRAEYTRLINKGGKEGKGIQGRCNNFTMPWT